MINISTNQEPEGFLLLPARLTRGNPISRKEDWSRFDLGLVYKEISRYSDLAEEFEFIQSVWKPDPSFKLPQNEAFRKQRKFRQDWLIRYPWAHLIQISRWCFLYTVLLFRSRVRQECYQA